MKITIVVDMQNDFIDGILGSPQAKAILPKVVEEIRKKGSDIYVFTRDCHSKTENSVESRRIPAHCIVGSHGWEMPKMLKDGIEELKKDGVFLAGFEKISFCNPDWMKDFLTVCKHRKNTGNMSSICSQEIDDSDEIEIFGLCTDICVISNALVLRSAFPSTPITVRSSLCAGVTPEKHNAALEVMRSCLIDVVE